MFSEPGLGTPELRLNCLVRRHPGTQQWWLTPISSYNNSLCCNKLFSFTLNDESHVRYLISLFKIWPPKFLVMLLSVILIDFTFLSCSAGGTELDPQLSHGGSDRGDVVHHHLGQQLGQHCWLGVGRGGRRELESQSNFLPGKTDPPSLASQSAKPSFFLENCRDDGLFRGDYWL